MESPIGHGAIAEHFESLVDPRVERAKRHDRSSDVPNLLGRRIDGLHQPKEDL